MTAPDPLPSVRAARLDAWLTRRGVVGVARRDRLLALVVALATAVALPVTLGLAAATGEVLVPVAGAVPLVAACTAQCLLLAVRRTRPVACVLLVALGQVAVVLLTPPDVGARGPASVMAAYAVATMLPPRTVVRALSAAVAVETLGALVVGATGGGGGTLVALAGVASGAVLSALAALAGSHVATRRRYVDLVRRQAAEAVATQEARVRSAIAGERTRMARELHDVAAHHLSGMVVQATATAHLVDRDPEATRAGLLAIRSQGRRTLEDLRMLVGVLRDPAAAEDGGPVPGLGAVGDLVAAARDLGSDVRLDRRGEPVALAPLADVAAYRLVQESLSNARQHAPGATVRVDLAHDDGGLMVTIENDATPVPGPARAGEGAGLVGMRERMQLVGGRLEVGPTPAGGWRVCAQLPTERVPG